MISYQADLQSFMKHVITTGCQTEFDIDQELLKLKEENVKLRNENSDLKKGLENFMYTKDEFKNNEELVTYYTGLADFSAVNDLFNLAKLDIAMKRGKLNPFEIFTLCLMRLHLGMAVVDLANRFQICRTTASKVFFVSVICVLCKIATNYSLARRFRINSFYANVFSSIKITTVIDCFDLNYILKAQPI